MRRAGHILLLIIYLGFVSLGLPDGTFGVAWPAIAAELHLSIGLAGAITVVVTLLSAVSGFQSARVVGRFGTGPVVMVSCVLTSSALLAIANAQGLAWLVVAAVPLGLGAGAVDAALNGFVAHHYSGRHMNWLHACWGFGATTGPLVMGWAIGTRFGWNGGYMLLGLVQLSLAVLFLSTLRLWASVPERHVDAAHERDRVAPTLGANSFAGWLSPVIFAIYVALEAATGIWAASILILGRGLSAEQASWCSAGYYGSIMTGRILVGIVVDRWGNRRLITAGVLVALTGAFAFALSRSPALAAVSLMLIGLGFAPIYPGLMHEVPKRFAPEAVQTIIGRQSGASSLGWAVFPASLGWVAEWSLNAIPWFVAVGIVAMLIGIARLNRLT